MACDPLALAAKLNEAENSIGRAMRAAARNNLSKAWVEAKSGIALAEAALAMCHDEVPHEHPSPTPAPVPAPTPTPKPFHDVRFEDYIKATSAAHNEGEGGAEGAFRYTANVAWVGEIDPIVRPGERGTVHEHKGWGNIATDQHSTYATLSTSGSSTITGDKLFRSAEWSPTLRIPGYRLLPDVISGYYKLASPERRPDCQEVVNVPAGLKLIFGNTMLGPVDRAHVRFLVWDAGYKTLLGEGPTLDAVAHLLAPGYQLRIRGVAPNCWNGVDLDSANHRSHMAYTLDPYQPTERCPETHPFLTPSISRLEDYTLPDLPLEILRAMRLSSDMPGQPAGGSMHWDYMECIHPEARRRMFEALLKRLNCSASDFGDGWVGVRPAGFSFIQRPNLIPIP